MLTQLRRPHPECPPLPIQSNALLFFSAPNTPRSFLAVAPPFQPGWPNPTSLPSPPSSTPTTTPTLHPPPTHSPAHGLRSPIGPVWTRNGINQWGGVRGTALQKRLWRPITDSSHAPQIHPMIGPALTAGLPRPAAAGGPSGNRPALISRVSAGAGSAITTNQTKCSTQAAAACHAVNPSASGCHSHRCC